MDKKNSRYSIEREIGRGAFGVVYLARDSRLERDVALKVMSLPDGLKEEEVQRLLDRFYREARAAASLSHPNIVIIHDISKSRDTHFISMELLEGEPLSELISEPMPVARVLRISEQVLSALEYAHEKGVVHRDIKPDNIFILPGDDVKLVDFGLARVQTATTMTRTGTVMGSPGYISPEVIDGRKADERTDVFSFGVVVYEMLTGVRPFGPRTGRESFANVIFRILQEEPEPPSETNPEVPPWLDVALSKSMAKDPDDRFQSAGEFRRALENGATGTPVAGSGEKAGTVVMGGKQATAIPAARPVSATRVEGDGGGEDGKGATTVKTGRKYRIWIAVIGGLVLVAAAVVLVLFLTGVFSAGGGGQASVPNLINLDRNIAVASIRKAGLRLGSQEEQFAYDIWKGKVCRQFPLSGTTVQKGSTVDIWVSLGNDVAAVPDVVGQGEEEAIRVIETFGFKAKVEPGYSPTAPVGTVFDEKPAPMTVKAAGDTVVIMINTGNPQASAPKSRPTQPGTVPPRSSP